MPLPKGRHLSLNFKLLALFGEKRGRLVYDTFVVLILPAYKNEGWLDAGYWVLGIGYWVFVQFIFSLFVEARDLAMIVDMKE